VLELIVDLIGYKMETSEIGSRLVVVSLSCELQFGAGYRVYYGREDEDTIILLVGGDKGS
jgi:putative component of toxin-antitoxin plasmid stabilization module